MATASGHESTRCLAPRLKHGIALLVLGSLPLATGGCNKGPAGEAIRAAESALATAPEIETDVPEEHAAISGILREARASFAAGRYTDALRAAQPLPDRVAAAAQATAKRRQQAQRAWSDLSAELPARLEALTARLALLSSAGAVSSERLEAAQAELAALKQAWAEAIAGSERAEIAKAVAAGQDVRAKAESLARRLGMSAAASGGARVR